MTAYCKTVERLKKENERLKRTLESGSQDIQYAEKLLRSKVSTLSANEKAVIPITCIQELLDISLRLEGEECITQVARFADCLNDTVTKELAVMATLRFYSNVRYLVERIKDIIYR